ncbi:MAG: hypothetical protein IPM16_08485 [Chloroflexi bacterium]|nr:hypothetical protein [Chloroflexota bacterium]
MGYGLNRAVPMSVIGFVAGAGLVILLRALQSMDEVWDAQLGLISAGFFGVVFFLWGIGSFSSEMAAHHVHEPEEDEFGNEIEVADDHHHGEEKPVEILSGQVWTVAMWSIVLFAGLLLFASLPNGLGYTVSGDPAANANANAFIEFNLFGTTVQLSKLVALVIFGVVTMVSLVVAAGGIAYALFGMNRGLKTVQAIGNQPLTAAALGSGVAGALPAGEQAEPAPQPNVVQRLRPIVTFVVLFVVLYVLFYEVAIGLVMAQPYWLRIMLSAVNAAIFALLILRPKLVLFTIGRIARFTARVLRGLPAFLFQRD